MFFQMKAFTMLMAIGVAILLKSEFLIAEDIDCHKSCDGEFCQSLCDFFQNRQDKTGNCFENPMCPSDKPISCKCD